MQLVRMEFKFINQSFLTEMDKIVESLTLEKISTFIPRCCFNYRDYDGFSVGSQEAETNLYKTQTHNKHKEKHQSPFHIILILQLKKSPFSSLGY